MSFLVEIASVPDRDKVVAEIWYGENMVAEIQSATEGIFKLEIYPCEAGRVWSFDLKEWIAILEKAKQRLSAY